jgi:hypothetical protein
VTGRDYERKFVNACDEEGVEVLLSGSSGSGTDDDRPDFVAGRGAARMPVGGEIKTTRDNACTIPESEADQLRRWCERFGAEPVIVMYWKGPPGGNVSYGGWWIRALEGVRRSPAENADGGHHLRPRREDREEWSSPEDLIGGEPL